MSDSPSDAILEFLAVWLADREAGRERELSAYLALFPTHEAEIEAEWERVRATTQASASNAGDAPAVIAGFRLVRELGRGGQARVWLAEDERLGRRVALKLVPRSPFTEDLAPRLRREARTASRLDHPGLCTVYDAGVEGATAWIALRYVEGETLAQRIAAEKKGERPHTSVEQILIEGEALARALHSAHEAGVVHRDVKPSNVMFARDGTPVVLDFGIALEDEGEVPLTLTGDAPGTPAYMAPERLEGRSRADARTDVWSLGVTLYEALTLSRPFDGPTRAAETRAVLERSAPDPRELRREIPRDVSLVIATALAARPGDRYATALDFAEDLRRAREHEPLRARPPGAALRLVRWTQRRPALAASLGALGLALIAGLSVSLFLWLKTRDALRGSEALFADVGHLANTLDARRLIERFPALWPALDTRASGFEDWLAEASHLDARLPVYESVLAATRARLDLGEARATDEWLLEGLQELLGKREQVALLRPRVEAGLAFARDVRRRSIGEARDAWTRAAAEVGDDLRFGGFALEPQLGLVPLGADRDSGLQEFAHLASGVPPRRDPATGQLEIGSESAIVLVLVPGGATRVGVVKDDAPGATDEPQVDPWAWRWDGPIVDVRLDPYFIAKHELTQGQWQRHTGENPSAYQAPSSDIPAEESDEHPVEEVSWEECEALLRELDLELPSEARWERAARAEGVTPWWTGSERSSLAGAANLADRAARERGSAHSWTFEEAFDDGFVVHAPVGRLRANPFGLHDVAGNVGEWCADGFEDWSIAPPRDGDGRALGTEPIRPFRGGSFTTDAIRARSSARDGYDRNVRISYIGVRAARSVRPAGE